VGRKHKHPEHENHERWLVSYADFITLLFATFTALYAIATADLAKASKAKETAAAISQSFQDQSLMAGIKSIIKGQSAPNNNPNPLSKKVGEGPGVLGKYDSLVPKQGVKSQDPTVEELNTLVQHINQQLKALTGATLSIEKGGVRITFDSALLYDSGNAQLKPSAIKALNLLAPQLQQLATHHTVVIEGHTDSQPMRSSVYPSNWELSAARACTVVRHLLAHSKGLKGAKFSAVGFGDTRPRASNATAQGQARNRRIDIFVQGFTPVKTITVKGKALPALGSGLIAQPKAMVKPVVSANSKGVLHNRPTEPQIKATLKPVLHPVQPAIHPVQGHMDPAPKATGGAPHAQPAHHTVVPVANGGFVAPRFEPIEGLPGPQ
jgi:chemotaxis protein MotB